MNNEPEEMETMGENKKTPVKEKIQSNEDRLYKRHHCQITRLVIAEISRLC